MTIIKETVTIDTVKMNIYSPLSSELKLKKPSVPFDKEKERIMDNILTSLFLWVTKL